MNNHIFKFFRLFCSILLLITLCGCPSTYFSAQLLEIGYTEHCADLSRIKDCTIYEHDGKNYIQTPVLECQLQTYWYAARPGARTEFMKTGESDGCRIIEIDRNTRDFLLNDKLWDDQYIPLTRLNGSLSALENLPSDAVPHKIPILPNAPQIAYNVWGSSMLDNTILLESSRSWQSYAVMPLLLITLPVDISTTVILTTFQIVTMPAVELYNYSHRW